MFCLSFKDKGPYLNIAMFRFQQPEYKERNKNNDLLVYGYDWKSFLSGVLLYNSIIHTEHGNMDSKISNIYLHLKYFHVTFVCFQVFT